MAKRMWGLAAAGLLAFCGGGRLLGDVLIKTDGSRMEGKIVTQDDKTVTFETNYEGLSIRLKMARSEIKSLTQEVREGVGYCILPLEGEVGVEITAKSLTEAIEMARRDGVSYVILRINSNGGKITDMSEIVNALAEASKKVHIVAYVEKGFSAAAIIAMACPTIYMAGDARIGAAVPFKMGPTGTPENIEQKFLSTITAEMRMAAEIGNHPTILVKGMSDIGIELVLRKENGKPVVVEVAAGKEATGDEIIKDVGRIMTMTALEAEKYGLSAGTVTKVEDLQQRLGLKAWFHAGKGAEEYLARAEKSQAEAQASHVDRDLGNTIADCEDKKKEIEAKLQRLKEQLATDEDTVKSDYDKALEVVHPPSELQRYKDLAEMDAKRKWADLHADYDRKVNGLREDLAGVLVQEAILRQVQAQRNSGN